MANQIHPIRFYADDFGLHPDIDRGILELAEAKKLTGVSILSTSPNYSTARAQALQNCGVKIGLHLALTETYACTYEALPSLFKGKEGKFKTHWTNLLPTIIYAPFSTNLIVDEWLAQYDKLRRDGIQVDYVDSHQNVHLFPRLLAATKIFLAQSGIRSVRVFCDSPRITQPVRSALTLCRFAFSRDLWLKTYGIYASGHLTKQALADVVHQVSQKADKDVAIVTHPGHTLTTKAATAPAYTLSWEDEYSLLLNY